MSKASRGIRRQRQDKYARRWPSDKTKAPSPARDEAPGKRALLGPQRRGWPLPT